MQKAYVKTSVYLYIVRFLLELDVDGLGVAGTANDELVELTDTFLPVKNKL